MWSHWAVHASYSRKPFARFEDARWAWERLRQLYPDALAATLMPDHLHLVIPATENEHRLGGFLGSVSRQLGVRNLWQRLAIPTPLPNRKHLRRTVRYLALNPCRDQLCSDPLEWIWSTYRDVIGG